MTEEHPEITADNNQESRETQTPLDHLRDFSARIRLLHADNEATALITVDAKRNVSFHRKAIYENNRWYKLACRLHRREKAIVKHQSSPAAPQSQK